MNLGQMLLLIIGLILTISVFLVIMLGNISTKQFQFTFIFKNFVSLRSLVISGLRYALYQINQNPDFVTSSAQVVMPQGNFIYSVSNINSTTKGINVQANLNSPSLTKILKATATINSSGTILNLEVDVD